MPDALVSVIVPVMQDASTLASAFDSLLIQSHTQVERVVVTWEASTETVQDTLLPHRGKFRHLSLPDGTDRATMLSRGLALCGGAYVAWLSPDDLCDPRRIEAQLAAMAGGGGHAVACCSTQSIRQDGSVLGVNPMEEITGSALWPLLGGGIDPASLLVPRTLLEAVGGMDGRFPLTFELELAVRLACRFPFRPVNTPLLRRRALPPPDQNALTAELEDLWRRLLDPANPWSVGAQASFTLAPLGRAWRCLQDRPLHAADTALRKLVEERVGVADIAIGVLARPDGAAVDIETIPAQLGLSKAEAVVVSAPQDGFAAAVAELLDRTSAPRVALVDPFALGSVRLLVDQLLHMEAFNLDACLPLHDPLLFRQDEEEGAFLGCLFRRRALQAAQPALAEGEARFWTEVRRGGRVAALPTKALPRLQAPAGEPASKRETPGQAPPPTRNSGQRKRVVFETLVDSDWYRAAYADVAAAGIDPIGHYRDKGWRELRDPNLWFSTAFYVRENPECLEAGLCPLDHFVTVGAALGRRPSPAFDILWYSRRYLGSDQPTVGALRHFLTDGTAQGAVPHPILDTPDVARALIATPRHERSGFLHGLFDARQMEREALDGLLDAGWYKAIYTDVAEAGLDPLFHYQTYGWKEGRDPNPWFSTSHYLASVPQRLRPDEDPLLHFIRRGAAAGCSPYPGFDLTWYSRRYLAGAAPSADGLIHFTTTGLGAGTVPTPSLHHASVEDALLAVAAEDRAALIKKMMAFDLETGRGPMPWRDADAELWPSWLLRGLPKDTLPVLILCRAWEPESWRAAQAASRVLPLEEGPLFLAEQGDGTTHLGSFHPDAPAILKLDLPHQLPVLQSLVLSLHCRRAASVDQAQQDSALYRAVSEARLQLFSNGVDRRKAGLA